MSERTEPKMNQEIIKSYQSGLSLRKLEEHYGIKRSKLKRLLIDSGITIRSVGRPTIPFDLKKFSVTNQGYLYRRDKGKRFPEHIRVWEENHQRKVPGGHVIHHIDKNKHNNNIDNLQLLTYSEHNKLHS